MAEFAKIITVAQQKGGAGKTTISAHIAVALAQKGNKVALIDADPQNSLTCWYKIRQEAYGEEYTGLYFKTISGWKIDSEITSLRRNYDFIVIDSPPHSETDVRAVIRSADLVMVPVQPSPTDFWATKKTLEILENAKTPYKFVLNRVAPNSKMAEEIAKELGQKNMVVIGNRIAFASSIRDGKVVTETQPKSSAAEEIKLLVSAIQKSFIASKKKAA